MTFTFTASVEIPTSTIESIASSMKLGFSFREAFYDEISGLDDFEFYSAEYYIDEVEREVQKLL